MCALGLRVTVHMHSWAGDNFHTLLGLRSSQLKLPGDMYKLNPRGDSYQLELLCKLILGDGLIHADAQKLDECLRRLGECRPGGLEEVEPGHKTIRYRNRVPKGDTYIVQVCLGGV